MRQPRRQPAEWARQVLKYAGPAVTGPELDAARAAQAAEQLEQGVQERDL